MKISMDDRKHITAQATIKALSPKRMDEKASMFELMNATIDETIVYLKSKKRL